MVLAALLLVIFVQNIPVKATIIGGILLVGFILFGGSLATVAIPGVHIESFDTIPLILRLKILAWTLPGVVVGVIFGALHKDVVTVLLWLLGAR
jgi:hypothetical protein